MVSKVGGSSGPKAGGFMPTQDQLKTTYAGIADKVMSSGKAKAIKPPAGIEKYTSIDITKKGELGVDQKVYTYKGELYLKSTPVVPNAKSSWYKLGPMPMF